MRIAICDDDERELTRLSRLMTEYQISRGISLQCRFFRNGVDFLGDMRGGEYDLVLLDVIMPGMSGIQIAQELRGLDENVRIVFISSSSEFAVESYHVGAYHYLLKPSEADSLFSLLDKVRSELLIREEEGFVLKNREGIVRISFAELEYLEVINKTVTFHLAGGIIREVTAALADFEGKFLARPEFVKPHRSYIINLSCVQTIDANCVVTKSGYSIPISRQRRNKVRDAYMHFLHQEKEALSVSDARKSVSSEKPERPDGPWRILLVDDDPADCTLWGDILRCHGCVVELAKNGREALERAESEDYDCVLLDIMIPGEDGFAICERLCKVVHAPVIFLSCLTESDKQVEGFAVGGIDYITKDTPAELFWAKVKTRIKLAGSDRTRFCYGPLLVDLTERRVLLDGNELPLTPIEFDILWLLAEHSEHIFTQEEIFDMIWGNQLWDGGQMVQMNMSKLRRKLEKAWDKHHFIEAVWGQGYRFHIEERKDAWGK